MEEYCQFLAKTKEYETDAILVSLVRLQRIAKGIGQNVSHQDVVNEWWTASTVTPTELHVQSFRYDIQYLGRACHAILSIKPSERWAYKPPPSHVGYVSRMFDANSDGIGLASIWIGGGAPTGFGSGSFDLDAGVAWIEAHGAPGAPQLIPH